MTRTHTKTKTKKKKIEYEAQTSQMQLDAAVVRRQQFDHLSFPPTPVEVWKLRCSCSHSLQYNTTHFTLALCGRMEDVCLLSFLVDFFSLRKTRADFVYLCVAGDSMMEENRKSLMNVSDGL